MLLMTAAAHASACDHHTCCASADGSAAITSPSNLCRRIQVEMPPHQLGRFHFFNTFFFKKLTEKPSEAARERELRRLGASLGVAEGEDPLDDCKTQEERGARMNYQRVRKWTKVGLLTQDLRGSGSGFRSTWDLRRLPCTW